MQRSAGRPTNPVVALLVERGARHHIFSAIAIGDLDLIRRLVADNPEALNRRRSRFEQRQTALHDAISRHRYDILDLHRNASLDPSRQDEADHRGSDGCLQHGDRHHQHQRQLRVETGAHVRRRDLEETRQKDPEADDFAAIHS